MEAAVKTFFSSPRFAVAGASSDPRKFGHKVFAWYLAHNLPVTPINPSCTSITVPPPRQRPASTSSTTTYDTIPNPSALPSPSQYSLSVITPPKITRQLLREAKDAGVNAVWLQPGSFDKEGLEFARREWPGAAVGGEDPDSRSGEGWCVLVDGEWAMIIAGRGKDGERL